MTHHSADPLTPLSALFLDDSKTVLYVKRQSSTHKHKEFEGIYARFCSFSIGFIAVRIRNVDSIFVDKTVHDADLINTWRHSIVEDRKHWQCRRR